MNTIGNLITTATSLLSKYKINNPRLDCELIMQHILNISRTDIIVNHDNSVNTSKEKEFWALIEKRAKFIPVSQIIGKREFWSLDFIVNNNVLDPRADTETLIETVLQMYTNKNQRLKIADLGTGSGCILITLLKQYPNSQGIAFEKNLPTYRVAYQNAIMHNILARMKIFSTSWQKCQGNFDIIVSNPPYIRRDQIKKLQPEIKLYEPTIALDGGISGSELYPKIFTIINKCLKASGKAILEIGEAQNKIHSIVPKYGLKFHKYVLDLAQQKRCIVLSKR